MELLYMYDWPGNVRELQNVVHHVLLMSETDRIDIPDLPCDLNGRPGNSSLRLDDLEREHILRILKQSVGDRNKAAEVLGIHPRTLARKLEEYGVET